MSEPKYRFYKAILHTANKTDEQLQAESSTPLSAEELRDMRALYNAWDGVRCVVMQSKWNRRENRYCYIGCLKTDPFENAQKAKEAIYLMEQDPLFGTYINQREAFDRDYDSDNYEPAGSIVFQQADVEIISECTAGGKCIDA